VFMKANLENIMSSMKDSLVFYWLSLDITCLTRGNIVYKRL